MIQTIKPTCVEELSQVVSPWQLTLRQLSGQELQPTITFASVDDILVTNDCWRGHVHGYGGTAAGFFTIAGSFVPCQTPATGGVLEENSLACAAGNAEWEFHTPHGTNHWVLLIPEHTLADYMGLEPQDILTVDGRPQPCDSKNFQRLRSLISKALSSSPVSSRALVAKQQLKAEILAQVAELLAGFTTDQDSTTSRTPYAAYRKATRYVSTSGPPATIHELAAAAGVSVRVLQLAFSRISANSP